MTAFNNSDPSLSRTTRERRPLPRHVYLAAELCKPRRKRVVHTLSTLNQTLEQCPARIAMDLWHTKVRPHCAQGLPSNANSAQHLRLSFRPTLTGQLDRLFCMGVSVLSKAERQELKAGIYSKEAGAIVEQSNLKPFSAVEKCFPEGLSALRAYQPPRNQH
ncbi:hypothetical protein D3C75_865030 [compost metagenome]